MLKKNLDFLKITDETVYPAVNILEGWHIFHLNGRIHTSVLGTKIALYGIMEPRYNQIKLGYQIQKNLDIEQSDDPYCFAYILAPSCCTEMGLNLKPA